MPAAASPCPSPERNRRDHYIPQGYLKGFIDPNRKEMPRPLYYFDKPRRTWSPRSPKEIAYRNGFYDYSVAEMGVETADKAFAQLEHQFPKVRKELVRKEFRTWKQNLDFLLRYAQMLRARSLLFFEEQQKDGRNLRALKVAEVGADRRTIRVESMTPEPLPESFIRNWTITNMREEISRGAGWLAEFHWALRYTNSVTMPFVTTEQPLYIEGPQGNAADAVRDSESLLFFPLCWQACLIGSRQYFQRETDQFGDHDMRIFATRSMSIARSFIVSPTRLDVALEADRPPNG
jgi:hypothetical protein